MNRSRLEEQFLNLEAEVEILKSQVALMIKLVDGVVSHVNDEGEVVTKDLDVQTLQRLNWFLSRREHLLLENQDVVFDRCSEAVRVASP